VPADADTSDAGEGRRGENDRDNGHGRNDELLHSFHPPLMPHLNEFVGAAS
jgi:hypothetical protein